MFSKFSKAKRLAVVLVPAALALGASAARAGNVGVDVMLHLGNQPQQVVVPVAPPPAQVIVRGPAPPAVVTVDDEAYDDDDNDDGNCYRPRQVVVPVAPPPAQVIVREPAPPAVVTIDDDVNFVYPARLGFYVAVGVPYDLFYARNNYYLFRDGSWFRALGSNGPWVATRYRDLPPGLRRHDIERIRAYRRAEYDIYRHDRDRYRGRHFMIGREEWNRADKKHWKEAKREEREYRKEMKRAEKEERKHDKGWGHDYD